MTPRICVSIMPKSHNEALSLIKQAEEAKASLIEVRLDCLETSQNLRELVKITEIPLIATNKLKSEGGFFVGSETQRLQTIVNATEAGFEYFDIDLTSPKNKETINKLKQSGAKPIVSFHNYERALRVSEMERILEQEIANDADVCKIVGTAKTVEDNLAVLNFVASNSEKAKLVSFCMGESGKVSRLLSPLFGAFFTFASLEQRAETAEGQMSIREMQVAYNLLGAK